MLEERFGDVEQVIRFVGRQKRISQEDQDDFASYVYMKLLERDSRRLREYRGTDEGSWRSYLNLVISNLASDYIKKEWGRWEPSNAAKRIGELGELLEFFLYREGRSTDEAIAILMDRIDRGEYFCLSPQVFDDCLKIIPSAQSVQIRHIVGIKIYNRTQLEKHLKEALRCKCLPPYGKDLVLRSRSKITREIVEKWVQELQRSFLKSKQVPLSYDGENEENLQGVKNHLDLEQSNLQPDQVFFANSLYEDSSDVIPKIINALPHFDRFILKHYLVTDLKVSEIVRLLDQTTFQFQKVLPPRGDSLIAFHRKRHWVQNRIDRIMGLLRAYATHHTPNPADYPLVISVWLDRIEHLLNKVPQSESPDPILL